jgi:hypothetical protein
MKPQHIVLVVLFALGAGFLLGRLTTAKPLPGVSPSADVPIALDSGTATTGDSKPMANAGRAERTEDSSIESMKAQAIRIGSGSIENAELAQAWADFFANLKNADIPSLAATLASAKDDKLDNGVRAVYAAWTEKDPAGAWRSALSFSVGNQCNGAMHAVLDTVSKRDPAVALAMAQAIENSGLREHMMSSALQALAKSEPSRAFALTLPSAQRGETSGFYSVLSQWVGDDPAGAQRAVANLQGQLGEQARLAVVQGMVEKDPEAAWKYATQLPPPTERYSFWDPRTQVIERWSRIDPGKAIDAALTIRDMEVRNRAVAQAVDSWASADFAAALTYAGSLNDPGLRGNVLASLARNQNSDPATMFEVLLDQAPAGGTFGNAISGLMSRWASSDPRQAAAATLQLPAGEALNSASRELAQQWAASAGDTSEVLAWVAKLPLGQARSQALDSVFDAWSVRDPSGAQRAWAALGSKDKQAVISSLTGGWSRSQPAEAARWAASMPDQPGSQEALSRAISAWAQSSPTDAANFVQTVPEKARPNLTSQLIERWYSADPFAAAEWLKGQPLGASKDAGVMAIATEIANENPETALAWTKSIADQDSRLSQERNILHRWMQNDATRASAWIRTAQLPPETKAELLSVTP